MLNVTKKALLTAGAVIALSTGLPGGQAQAVTLSSCTPILDFPSGNSTKIITFADVSGSNCVQFQDKKVGNFTLSGAASTAGFSLSGSLNVIGKNDFHLFGIQDSFTSGHVYTFGYEVYDTGGPNISRLDADFTQTSGGPSTLTKNTTPKGVPTSGISETKIGTTSTGNTIINYSPLVQDIVIAESLTDNGTISGITNTVIEGVLPTPEPASLGLLGVGLVGLAVIRRRKKQE